MTSCKPAADIYPIYKEIIDVLITRINFAVSCYRIKNLINTAWRDLELLPSNQTDYEKQQVNPNMVGLF